MSESISERPLPLISLHPRGRQRFHSVAQPLQFGAERRQLGFGADQAAFVYGLGLVAVAPGAAFAASTLGSGLKLLFNLVGGGLALALQPIEYKNLSHNQ